MTLDLTREEMIDDLIEDTYESMDFRDLYDYVEYYEQRFYSDLKTEEIETEYKQRFDLEDD